METVVDRPVPTHRVGKYEFRVVADEADLPPAEIERMRARRVEALTRWLTAQWQRHLAERN